MTELSVSRARHVRFDRDDWAAIAGMAGFIVLLHVIGWGLLVGLIAPRNYQLGSAGVFGIGLGLTAYLLGIRHAFDADH
ncbi:MAG: HoxN/HupN/NixA family nickel/cobalt transporter, partial [Pseudonocardia sp.]|nr:HoxN/HupN/NixA family nickel/cobalt transporter [Pseudonocardia sp.]